ncbi:60 kDa polyprotein [Rhizophagus clarus]|uniref:60 kDa polyprotein n=2 Tax=Rhizophagus clarus TaxID=94130 RepID=A0A8H3QPY2_9GLOM|nr:60 kDa polyprotein [Rhizophagus clarus]
MSAKKEMHVSRQCRIGQWIKAQDRDFLEAIENRYISLSPAKSAPGITFLYPKENTFRKEIIEKAYSANNAEEAIHLIKSLIIPDFVGSPADFLTKDVGNKLGIKLPIKDAGDDKVIFENGMEIIPAKNFSPIPPHDGSLAVWIITKGRPALEGEVYKFPQYLIPTKQLYGDSSNKSAWNDLNYNGNHNDMDNFLNYFKKIPGMTSISATDPNFSLNKIQPKIFQDIEVLKTQIQVIRQELLDETDLADLPKRVKSYYLDLANTNKLMGFGPIYPDSTNQALSGLKKLWQDEFRYVMYHALQGMRQDKQPNEDFADIIQCLRDLWTGNNYESEIILTNEKYQNLTIQPRQDLMSLKMFIQSSNFLYIPFPPNDKKGGSQTSQDDMIDHNLGALKTFQASHESPSQEETLSKECVNEIQQYITKNKTLPPGILSLFFVNKLCRSHFEPR